jgi:predicted DCC family thiol-disulfide oxidoreductase YuxK
MNTPTTVQQADSPETDSDGKLVVYFDGVCGLCNGFVDFLLRNDPRGRLLFAPLQGETAARNLSPNETQCLDSVIVSEAGRTYRESAAIVKIVNRLGPGWRMLGGMLWLIPRPLRDSGYRLLARHRYRFFGKHDTCRLPSPEERQRFLS